MPRFAQLDLRNKQAVYDYVKFFNPDIVIHCAALGSVDYAQSNPEETKLINVIGTLNLLNACKDKLFVYISSNAVFDGNTPPYNENSVCNPINTYGQIKRMAELAVMDNLENDWIIIRPFLLYGWPFPKGRQNWMTTILNKEDEINLVDDVYWQPTSARDCAQAIWQIIQTSNQNEIYHLASDEKVTLYEFGLKVCEVFDRELKINPIKSSELKGIAPRPIDTTFDLKKIHSMGIKLLNIEEGLKYERDLRK